MSFLNICYFEIHDFISVGALQPTHHALVRIYSNDNRIQMWLVYILLLLCISFKQTFLQYFMNISCSTLASQRRFFVYIQTRMYRKWCASGKKWVVCGQLIWMQDAGTYPIPPFVFFTRTQPSPMSSSNTLRRSPTCMLTSPSLVPESWVKQDRRETDGAGSKEITERRNREDNVRC